MYFSEIICMLEVWWTHPVPQEAAHELCGFNRFSTARRWSYAHLLVSGFTEQLLYTCVLDRIDAAKNNYYLLSLQIDVGIFSTFFVNSNTVHYYLWFLQHQKQTKASNLLITTQMENKTWEYPSKIKNCDFGIVHTSSSNKKLLFFSIENYFQNIHNIELRIHTPPPLLHPFFHSLIF